jgi:hypothetical protein
MIDYIIEVCFYGLFVTIKWQKIILKQYCPINDKKYNNALRILFKTLITRLG